MRKEFQQHSTAAVGTVLFMLLVFLLLWCIVVPTYEPEEDEGVEVEFVTQLPSSSSPAGAVVPSSPASPVVAEQSSSPDEAAAPPAENVMTQEDEEALLAARAKEEAERLAREEAERVAREKAEAEARAKAAKEAKEAEQRAKADALGSRLGKKGAMGSGTEGDTDWSLNGRVPQTLVQPSRDYNGEGTVKVEIEVDASGYVTAARVTKGTDTSDPVLIRLALEAAKNTKFNESQQQKAVGTITYHFKQS